jgi:hypothetical protein
MLLEREREREREKKKKRLIGLLEVKITYIFLPNGYLGLFSGLKWPRHEADHSSPSSAEVT